MEYSIVIPYQHSEEREKLFYACLENLLKLCPHFEICIHEVGREPCLTLPNKIKYLFTEFHGVFHRAWAINRGAKKIATGDILILMDCDLIVNSEWVQEVTSCETPSAGWGRINWLSKEGTETYLKKGYIDDSTTERTRTPSRGSAAGGITVMERVLFSEVSGIPEDFLGSWGGEDNAFWAKLVQLGYKFKSLNCTVYHLHHTKSTPQIQSIQKKALPMLYWSKSQWEEHIKNSSDSWGTRIPAQPSDSFDYVSEKSEARLTIAMLSWIRPEKLIETLTSLDETLTIPINLVLMVQGCETLTSDQRRVIKGLSNRFYRSDVFFTQGNIGTGPARHHLQKRALRRFPAQYLNFGDDDTTYTKGSVEAAIDLMDKDYSIGIVGIYFKPKVYRLNNHLCPRSLSHAEFKSSIEYVDSTGSASAIIRREVFDLCKVDPEYELGQWDLDLFLQARSIGWKIVNYKAFAGMKAINSWGGSKEYRAGRMDRKKIRKSIDRFKQKWGLLTA